MEKKYLGYQGLQDVAGHVNTRLKTVTTIPASADDGAVRLYVGETGVTYKKGHIYQYNATDLEWVDITSSSEYTAGNGIDITDDEISVETYIFTGTQAQWDALTTEQKKEYDICNITDDASSDDEIYTKSEIDAMLGTDYQKKDLETAIEGEITVEGALGTLSTNKADVDDVYTKTEADTLLDEKLSYADNGILGAKNLWVPTRTTGSGSDLTWTSDEDGIITVTGQNTGQSSYYIGILNHLILPKGTYIFSGCPTNSLNMSLFVRPNSTTQAIWGQDDGDSPKIMTLTEDTDLMGYIRVGEGVNVGTQVFKPMITLVSDIQSNYANFRPYAMTNKELTELTKVTTYRDTTTGVRFVKSGRVATVTFEQTANYLWNVAEGEILMPFPSGFELENSLGSLSWREPLNGKRLGLSNTSSLKGIVAMEAIENLRLRGGFTYVTN